MNGWQQGFRFVAGFGFGGQESASKPPQAICKPLCNIDKNHRELKFKIGLSLFFVGGFFFFWILGPIITNKLKSGLEKRNPKLVERVPVIFKVYHYFFRAFAIFCLLYIVLIWTGFVTIPTE